MLLTVLPFAPSSRRSVMVPMFGPSLASRLAMINVLDSNPVRCARTSQPMYWLVTDRCAAAPTGVLPLVFTEIIRKLQEFWLS